MRLSRRLVTVSTLLCTALIGTGVAAANAAAGDVTWSAKIATSAGTSSTGTVVYNPNTFYLDLQVTTGTLPAGRCVTVFFDWSAKGHHDSRAVRDCRSGDTVSFAFPDATPSNITGGASKLGVCYAPNDKLGTCDETNGTTVPKMNWTPWPDITRTTPCDLSWDRRNADGSISTYLDPHSQSAGLASPGAC
jgi:hypothetical protein